MPTKKADKETVRNVLNDARRAIDEGNAGFARRKKNRDTLNFYGWTEDDVYDRVYELNYGDYRKGPEPDDKFQGNSPPFWFFSYPYMGRRIYIKFSLDYEKPCPRLFVLSFHLEED